MVMFHVVGSGKTAAFVLPMLTYISKLPPMTEEIEAEGAIFTCYLFFQSKLWSSSHQSIVFLHIFACRNV